MRGKPKKGYTSAQAKQRIQRIQRERILRDVLQSDALHFRLEHIAGGKLRVGACCPVAKRFVAAGCPPASAPDHRRNPRLPCRDSLCGVSRGLCGVRSGLLAAGSRGYQQKSCQQCTHDLFFMFFLAFAVIDRRKKRKKATDAPAPWLETSKTERITLFRIDRGARACSPFYHSN